MCVGVIGLRHANRNASSMSTENQRVVILAAIDASPSGSFVAYAAARFVTPNVALHVVHVIEAPDGKHMSKQLIEGQRILTAATADLRPSVTPIFHLAAGAPVNEILQVAANLQADLLVLGTQELSSFERLFLGSVVEPVTRRAQCPVFVVRRKDYHQKVVKEIVPPCPDCVAKQDATHGAELWCERHSKRHVHGHLHYELADSYGVGSTFIRPEEGVSTP
jgi:nucleotide-binding universal stress UspA family protein